jgi:hypothetical protein
MLRERGVKRVFVCVLGNSPLAASQPVVTAAAAAAAAAEKEESY